MNVHDYIRSESERQSATPEEVEGMAQAHDYISGRNAVRETDIIFLASLINGVATYRNVPVFFRSGGHAVNHANIPRLMNQWVDALVDFDPPMADFEADFFAKEFLDIHPFTDGNGRVASLLWNWMRGTLDDPDPLPYFYGE